MDTEVSKALLDLKYSDRARRVLELPQPKGNPPTASRGVERTEDRRLIADWLSFTILDMPWQWALAVVVDVFGSVEPCLDGDDKPIGWRGYTESARICGSGRVAWHALQPAMGLHVDLPSSALGEWAGRGDRDLVGVLAYLKALGAKVARFDLAYDDRIGAIKLEQFERHLDAGAFSTRVQRRNCLIVRDLEGGRTYYFGDKTSEKRLRVYDKKIERRSAGQQVKGPWNRVELQLRGAAADEAVNLVIAGEHDPVGLIRGFVDIKELASGDSNNRRREPASWWLAFLEYASRLAIVLPDPGRTLDKVARWFARQVAPSFALLWEGLGGDFFALQLDYGQKRWKDIHRAMLETFRQDQLKLPLAP